MKLIYKPTVRVLCRPDVSLHDLTNFLEDNFIREKVASYLDSIDNIEAGDLLPEIAGRVCYMSFNKPRPGGNKAYLDHIKEVSHGSVLEHPTWSFIIEGVSRSLSHELVRHRAGIAISQLSQRYVDESDVAFVVPPAMAGVVNKGSTLLERVVMDNQYQPSEQETTLLKPGLQWLDLCRVASQYYATISEALIKDAPPELTGTDRRKWARQAARSVLPNCTETKMVWSANARALRHCIEMRAAAAADVEIRALFIEVLKVMQTEAPNLFSDYQIITLSDGTEAADTQWRKV